MNIFKKLLINFIPIKKWRNIIKEYEKKHCYSIKQHEKAASDYKGMEPFSNWLLAYTNIKPKIIFEIGANYGQDAAGLAAYLHVRHENCYLFEAHPDICAEIKKMYNKFNVYNYAVYNENSFLNFNAVDINVSDNSGISSLRTNHEHITTLKPIKIEAIRMDCFLEQNNINSIDFLKLDVEGCNYEVLEGFGNKLDIVKAIHIESEFKELWEGQKLFEDIELLLKNNGFTMVYFQRYTNQSDSFWIKKQYLKV